MLAGHHERHEPGRRVEADVLVLLEEVRRAGRGVDQDRLGRGDGGGAAPEDRDVEGVEAGLLQAELGGDLAGRVHLRDARREEQSRRGEVGAVVVVARHQPVLLAGGVGVVHAGLEGGLDDGAAEGGERADGVAHDLGAGEQLGERVDLVGDLLDLVVGGLDAGDVGLHGGLELVGAAAGGDERDAVLAEVFADQAAGVAGRAVDDDGLRAHGVTSPFRRRPAGRRR